MCGMKLLYISVMRLSDFCSSLYMKLGLKNKANGREAGHKYCIEPLQEQKRAEYR